MSGLQPNELRPFVYELPTSAKAGMRVPARIYTNEQMLEQAVQGGAMEQLMNMAFLPGIAGASLAMPDVHSGYGFPIGGVAAVDAEVGAVSPGGVGYDINCGVRLLTTGLVAGEIRSKLSDLMDELNKAVPTGVGAKGQTKLGVQDIHSVLTEGVGWARDRDMASDTDVSNTEEQGHLPGADSSKLSQKALARGRDQLGTLGAGNHFIELQEVSEVYDEATAELFRVAKGSLVVMIHSGSRGLGHQVCVDFLKIIHNETQGTSKGFPDLQMAWVPINSKTGQDYLAAMACAVNYAFVNRQILTQLVRGAIMRILGKGECNVELIYDVAHNIAKFEDHLLDGKTSRYLVHRKGATRAFGPGRVELPERYRQSGQPVIVPGDMGTASYLLAGTAVAMGETFGSTCHGAGRVLSRSQARKLQSGETVREGLESGGVLVRAGDLELLSEEAPEAYKDISSVVDVCHKVGIARKVAKMRPLGVIKG